MQARLERLRAYLLTKVGLEPEAFAVDLNQGRVSGQFTEREVFSLLEPEEGMLVGFEAVEQEAAFEMQHSYTLTIRLSSYRGDLDRFYALILYWLHQEQQIPAFEHVLERANETSFDLWLDLQIHETGRALGDQVHLC